MQAQMAARDAARVGITEVTYRGHDNTSASDIADR
jgi:hypothetical protein